MEIPAVITDQLLIRLTTRIKDIVGMSEKRIHAILSVDTLQGKLSDQTRERIIQLTHIVIFHDRWRRLSEYPYVIDPESSLKSWFRKRDPEYGGVSPLRVLSTDPERWIDVIYEKMRISESTDEDMSGEYRVLGGIKTIRYTHDKKE